MKGSITSNVEFNVGLEKVAVGTTSCNDELPKGTFRVNPRPTGGYRTLKVRSKFVCFHSLWAPTAAVRNWEITTGMRAGDGGPGNSNRVWLFSSNLLFLHTPPVNLWTNSMVSFCCFLDVCRVSIHRYAVFRSLVAHSRILGQSQRSVIELLVVGQKRGNLFQNNSRAPSRPIFTGKTSQTASSARYRPYRYRKDSPPDYLRQRSTAIPVCLCRACLRPEAENRRFFCPMWMPAVVGAVFLGRQFARSILSPVRRSRLLPIRFPTVRGLRIRPAKMVWVTERIEVSEVHAHTHDLPENSTNNFVPRFRWPTNPRCPRCRCRRRWPTATWSTSARWTSTRGLPTWDCPASSALSVSWRGGGNVPKASTLFSYRTSFSEPRSFGADDRDGHEHCPFELLARFARVPRRNHC